MFRSPGAPTRGIPEIAGVAGGLVGCVGITAISLLTHVDSRQLAMLWPVHMASLVTLSFVWHGEILPRRRAVWLVAILQCALVTGTITVLEGWVGGRAAYWAALSTAIALGMGILLMWGMEGRWYPRNSTHYALAQATALLAATTLVFANGIPNATPVRLGASDDVWWTLHVFVQSSLGLLFLMLPHYPAGSDPLATTPYARIQLPALAVLTLVVSWLAYSFPQLPLAWLMLIPALWAGLILTFRQAILFVAGLVLVLAMVTYGPISVTGFRENPYARVLMHMLAGFAGAATMLLIILRQMREEVLIALRRQRADARALAELQSSVLQSMSEGLLLIDTDGEVVFHNTAAAQVLGAEIPSQAPGSWIQYFGMRTPDGSAPLAQEQIDRIAHVAAHGGADSDEISIIDPSNGKLRVLFVWARGLDSSTRSRALILVRDITEQRQRQEQLLGFAQTVAHDLKSPIAGLDMWVRHLEQSLVVGDVDRSRMAVGWLRRGSAGVRRVVDEWLAFTVTRHSELRPAVLHLQPIVEQALDTVSASTPDRLPHVQLDLPHQVRADEHLTRQLLANLVGNAIKYTPLDRRPVLRIASRVDGPDWVIIEVEDRGRGIPPEEREKIFQEYMRSNRDAAVADGHGIGLALCREAVHRHGGWIRASGNEYGGATLTFTLPLA